MSQVAILHELLRQHAWSSHSFQSLKPGLQTWVSQDGEAAVAYSQALGYRVTAGPPVCAPEELAGRCLEFAADCRQEGYQACFFGVVDRMLAALSDASPRADWLQIGLQPSWDPRRWPEPWPERRLSARIRKAERRGIRVRGVAPAELAPGCQLHGRAQSLLQSWLEHHPMACMGHLVSPDPFAHRHERKYFGAFQGDELITLLVASPVYQRGWFLESMLTARQAPTGTAEAILDLTARQLASEEVSYMTAGLVALAGLPGHTPRHPWLHLLLRTCYARLGLLYRFPGIQAFLTRMRPHAWEPVYLAATEPITLATLVSVLVAFAEGRVDRFAARTAGKLVRTHLLAAGH